MSAKSLVRSVEVDTAASAAGEYNWFSNNNLGSKLAVKLLNFLGMPACYYESSFTGWG